MILDLFAIIVVLFLGFSPILLLIWGVHHLSRHPRLLRYSDRHQPYRLQTLHSYRNWLEPLGYIGDTSCRFNAHSPFIRCAVNPAGPCQSCIDYDVSPHLKDISQTIS